MQLIAETQRLRLRELETNDAQALHPVFSDPEATRFTLRIHSSLDETREWIEAIRRGYERQGFGPWAVVRRIDHELVGYCGCGMTMLDGAEQCEIGYRIIPSCWGLGYATEAMQATIRYAFERPPFSRLVALIQPANMASIRVAEKSGMIYRRDTTYEGVLMRVYEISRTDPVEPKPSVNMNMGDRI